MLSAPVTVSCTGNPIDSELLTPSSRDRAAHCGQRVSLDICGTDMVAAAADASRQGPWPDSYCDSSRFNARSPVNAAVCAPLPRTSVTDTSLAPGMVRLASPAMVSRTPLRLVSL